MFKIPEEYRITEGRLGSPKNSGNFGAFELKKNGFSFLTIADNGELSGWEHVSVSKYRNGKGKILSWSDMCYVKDLFWDKSDCVVQFHPPESRYVNIHDNVLHLWRQVGMDFPMPPIALV